LEKNFIKFSNYKRNNTGNISAYEDSFVWVLKRFLYTQAMQYNNQVLISSELDTAKSYNNQNINNYNIYLYKVLYNFSFLSSDFSFYKFFNKDENLNSANNTNNNKYFLMLNNSESLKNSDNNALKFLFSSLFFKKNKIVFYSPLGN
jgi:hypothetical protein